MHSYLVRFNSLWLTLILSMISLETVAEPEADPSWQKYRVGISYIDPEKRVFVASDREFFVPFNTPIDNAQGSPISLINLKLGDSIWLYVDRSNSKLIKRISLIQRAVN
jgi:hypothetical protein